MTDNMKSVTDYFVRASGEDWVQYKSIAAVHKATKIPRNKLSDFFYGMKTLSGYEFRTEERMRLMTSAEIWKANNKQRAGDYNKMYNNNHKSTTKTIFFAKKADEPSGEWLEFATASAAAKALGLHAANISKQLKGGLKQTGGYIFKKETVDMEPVIKTDWKDVCTEKGYKNECVGKVSPHRVIHTEQDGVMGKPCCTCKTWKSLTTYNKSPTKWDGLRNECKDCLASYRKKNKDKMTEYNKNYWVETKEDQTERHKKWKSENREHVNEYNRMYKKAWEANKRATDPSWKLLKNLRCRLWSALKSQSATEYKAAQTRELVGCDLDVLRAHLESKFTPEMTWENYGSYWHCDHVIPCASWDMTKLLDQALCFNYKNLQPLEGSENVSKGATFCEDEKASYVAEHGTAT